MERERGTEAVINTHHLSHNLAQFRTIHPGKIIAVVKADAYGHGLKTVVPYLTGCDAFAVATFEEAVELRQIDQEKRIILLEGVFNDAELSDAIRHQFDVVVHQDYQIELLSSLSDSEQLDVWLKVDTGMNRLGFAGNEVESLIEKLTRIPSVNQLRIMTHFASSDDQHGAQTRQQVNDNNWVKSLGFEYSFSNTGAVLNQLSDKDEWVRVGIGLFGISPLNDQWASCYNLKPVMHLNAKIIATKTIPAGSLIGYGGTFKAKKTTLLGIVGIGYADGYPWTQQQSHVVINRHKVPVVGRVSMDMMAVDLTDMPEVKAGSLVQIWGNDWPIEAVAKELGLIPYTLPCGITKRVKFNAIQ